jgi:hypothetical protein
VVHWRRINSHILDLDMDRFLTRRKFFFVFDAGQPVHGRR